MNDFSITKMTLSDLELILPSLATDYDDFWDEVHLRNELNNMNSEYIVCKNNRNEILGFAGIWKSVDDVHITDIVVKKTLRRTGVGSILLENLIRNGKKFEYYFYNFRG